MNSFEDFQSIWCHNPVAGALLFSWCSDAKGHRSSKSFGWTTFRQFSGLPFSPPVFACWFWNMFFEDIACGIEIVLHLTQEVHMKSSTLCYSTWWICENHKWCILYIVINYYYVYVIHFQLQFAVAAACCCTCHPCAEPAGFRALTVAARRLVKDLRLWSAFLLGAAALRFIQASSFLTVHSGCRLVECYS